MSETTTEHTTDTSSDQPDTGNTEQETTLTPDAAAAAVAAAQKEVEKWQALARKHEQRAKDNADAAKALDEVKRSQMSDQERAVAEAKAATRAEILAEVGSKFVAAEFKVAAAGRTVNGKPLDLDAILEGVNPAFREDLRPGVHEGDSGAAAWAVPLRLPAGPGRPGPRWGVERVRPR